MPQVPTRLLAHALAVARSAGPTDRELLRRYARSGDQAAFAEVVRRHGPMVLGAAARVLGRDPAAEDAFQLAFAALARGARTIRTESVGGWLHRTAVRAALKLRARQRASTELPQDPPGPAGDPYADVAWREVRQVVDAELNALPDRLRVPLVLYYLEALTRDEAAGRLGWSLRSLERRLGEGRAVLMDRLRRRGVVGLGAAVVATGGLTLPVPSALAESVVRSAPRPVVSLIFGLGMAVAVVVTVGVGIGLGGRPSADPPAKDPPAPVAKDAAADTPDVPLPPGAIHRFGSLTWRHPGGLSEAVLSADGKTLVTLGKGTLAVWDVPTGRRTYYSHDLDPLNTFETGNVAVAPDGSWVAFLARNRDPAVRLIDPATGKERLVLGPVPVGPARPAAGLVFCTLWAPADGKTLLLSDNQTLSAYDTTTGKELRTFKLPGRVVALAADGVRAVVHDQLNPAQAFVYDVRTGKQVVALDGDFQKPGSNSWFIRAAITPDGKRIATLSDLDPEIRLWDADTGKLIHTLKRAKSTGPRDDARLVSVAIAADGKAVYAGGISGTAGVRRWDAATGKELEPWTTGFTSVSAIVPGTDTVFTCSEDGLIGRRDARTGKEHGPPSGHRQQAVAARSPDGRTVVTADFSGRLFVWDAATAKLIRTVPLEGNLSGPPFAFSPDGKRFACALRVGRVALFGPATWKPAGEIKLSGGDEAFIRHLRFLADGLGLIVGHGRNTVERWDLGADKPKWSVNEESLALAVSPDGKHFAVSVARGVSIRSVADGSEVRLIPAAAIPDMVAFQIRVDSLAFSPDGSLVAGTRWDAGDVFVWDVATGKEVRKLVGHPTPKETRIAETSVAFSADGRFLATGHADHTARVWEVATGKEARRLTGHDATVTGVSFSRDGRTLLTTGGLEVLLWDLTAGADRTSDLETFWTDLGADDAAKAYPAAASLAARGDRAAEFLKGKLAPATAPPADAIAKLVTNLDSDEFRVREKAFKALADLGPVAWPALVARLDTGPSAEGRARIEELLGRLSQPQSGADARPARAVQALQWAGGDAARAVLKAWAGGAAGARLTEAARGALRVME